MDFFLLSTTGDLNDHSLCMVEDPPDGMGLQDYRMSLGERAVLHYPENARIYLREENPGIKLAGILGNTKGYLLGSSKAKEIIEEHCRNSEIEYLPFDLYNHKKRLHSKDYFFINPIGGFDCLNEDASEIEYDPDGEVITIEEFVIDPKKLSNAPDLFRIDKDPIEYIISKRLAEALRDGGVTNVGGHKLRIQAGKQAGR
ncbi:MAG: hypothetical protein JRE64_01115 [Deltaproteobacteria bacterium]|nr:hypothetical protein [Deltaproteobacteria bacterium]